MNRRMPKRTVLKDAFSLPGERINRSATSFGIYDAEGNLAPFCNIATSGWTAFPENRGKRSNLSTRFLGPALFAGSADKQFGFCLVNSLGRLWALRDLPAETVIIYSAKPVRYRVSFGSLSSILRSLGINNPISVLLTPARFEELHLAEELFGESCEGPSFPEYYDWIDRCWPAQAPPDPDRKIYVTRSGMGPEAGRFACEDHLERLLVAQGYEIYAPERHSLGHQVETYQSAGRLIFAESSALHLFAMVRRPTQYCAVIQRRPDLPELIARHLTERNENPVKFINVVTKTWWHPQRGAHLGKSVLDFDQLGIELAHGGFVSGKTWDSPTRAQLDSSLRAGLAPGEEIMSDSEREQWLHAFRQRKRHS